MNIIIIKGVGERVTTKDDVAPYLVDGATALPPTQHIVWAGQNMLPASLKLDYVSRPGDGRRRFVFQQTVRVGDRGAWDYIKRVLSGDITDDNPSGKPAETAVRASASK